MFKAYADKIDGTDTVAGLYSVSLNSDFIISASQRGNLAMIRPILTAMISIPPITVRPLPVASTEPPILPVCGDDWLIPPATRARILTIVPGQRQDSGHAPAGRRTVLEKTPPRHTGRSSSWSLCLSTIGSRMFSTRCRVDVARTKDRAIVQQYKLVFLPV